MKKRAVSAVVATVLLVLIVVLLAGIIWFGVSPLITEGMRVSQICMNARLNINSLSGYTCYDVANKQVRVMVSRGPQEYELIAIDVGLSGQGMKESRRVRESASWVLLYYPFDEGSGNTAIDSIGKNTAEIFGAAWVNGKYGNALLYDGIDDFANSTISSAYGDEITIEAWVLANDTSWQQVLGKADSFYLETNGTDFNVLLHIDGDWR